MNTFPRGLVPPDRTYRDRDDFELGPERVELYHATAETDDATWVFLPDRRVAFVGDLLIGSLPNTGHPNKTQRHTLGWAQALDTVAAHRPRWVLPGHGELLEGDHALEVLTETARALRFLHDAVVERLNEGKWPDEIVEESIHLPDSMAGRPYLAETSGCVQFVVRDVLRAYAGWWGGNPAELMPAPRGAVSRELVQLAGRDAILDRVGKLFIGGEARRALHLAVLLRQADPGDRDAWQTEAELCEALAIAERSALARSLYLACARSAREALADLDGDDEKPAR
jgi:alkyl sulfatase BDS1-like metallo-beta-lactamase superfamily hydrolase